MEPRWGDPEAPWWAKLRRAKSHISDVRQRVHALQVVEPWSVQREPAGKDGWESGSGSTSQFRRIWQQPPGMRWPICAPRSTTSPMSWPAITQER
jgi:hypothetical protein